MIQALRHSNQVVLDVGEVQALSQSLNENWQEEEGRTISDLGAILQFSLHLFAKPFTTSALLPISRKRPMTFLRHVPILNFDISLPSSVAVAGGWHSPP